MPLETEAVQATIVSYKKSPFRLWRFQCDPSEDGTFTVEAFFRTELENESDVSDKATKDAGSVSFILPTDVAATILALAEAARA